MFFRVPEGISLSFVFQGEKNIKNIYFYILDTYIVVKSFGDVYPMIQMIIVF